MTSISSIALSGMQAAQQTLNSSAHNIANQNTPGFHRQQVLATAQPDGAGVTTTLTRASTEGAALEADLVAQLQAKNAFLANLAVFKTGNQLAGELLDKTV